MDIIKLRKFYTITAVLLLNTLALLILLNVFLGIAFFVKHRISGELESDRLFRDDGAPLNNGQRSGYQLTWFDYTAYEQTVDERYAATVLDDFFQLGKLGFIYQPWVQFSEPRYNGKLVNVDVDSKGFPVRRTLNPEKDELPVIRIFALGGSTTFGYNVSDEQTWPSQLSDILNKHARSSGLPIQAEVTNYGRGYYNTSQETVLLIDLLKAGHRPNLVIFMDGVNWGPDEDVPNFTKKFARKFLNLQFSSDHLAFLSDLDWVPMIRLTNVLTRELFSNGNVDDEWIDKSEYVKHVVNRFRENRKIAARLCELYGINALFFLQPDAVYNYPEHLYRLSLPDSFLKDRELRKDFYKQMKNSSGFIDFTWLFSSWGENRKAIVDDCHYSPFFNRFLAQHVAHYIDLSSLVNESLDSNESVNTGATRHPETMEHETYR
jgi:hypothetical protein